MGRLAAVACLALVAVACGDSGSAPTTSTSVPTIGMASPAAAVDGFVAAVSEGPVVARLVPDTELVALVATENELTIEEIAGLVRAGVTSELRDSYWQSFADSFEEFSGLPLAELEVESVVEFTIGTQAFATVEVGFPTRIGSTFLVTNKQEPGGWHVDLVASLAPSLLRPIRSLVTTLPENEDGDTVRGLFTDLVPSFRAIAESPVEEHVTEPVRREIEALVRFISPAIGSG